VLVGPYVRRDGLFCFAGITRGELGETEEDWERWKDSPADMAGWDKKKPGLAALSQKNIYLTDDKKRLQVNKYVCSMVMVSQSCCLITNFYLIWLI